MADSDLFLLLIFCVGFAWALLAVFLLPVRIRALGEYQNNEWSVRLSLGWAAFGVSVRNDDLWHVEVSVGRTSIISRTISAGAPADEEQAAGEEKKEKTPSVPIRPEQIGTLLPHVERLLGRVVAHTYIEKLSLWIRADAGGPVATGKAFGAVQALQGMLWATPIEIRMEPLFSGGEAAGRGEVSVRIDRPVVLIIAAVVFALSPPVRQMIQERTGEK